MSDLCQTFDPNSGNAEPGRLTILQDSQIYVGQHVWIISNNSSIPEKGMLGEIKSHQENKYSDAGTGYTTEIKLSNGKEAMSSIFCKYWYRMHRIEQPIANMIT